MAILNLTQHCATPDQKAAGVIDLPADVHAVVKELLTFESLEDIEQAEARYRRLAGIAIAMGIEEVMIGTAPWGAALQECVLQSYGLRPLYSFSKREVVEEPQPDGSVKKTMAFRHEGFVSPLVEFIDHDCEAPESLS